VLFAITRTFVASRVMHRLAMEFYAALSRSFAASRQRSAITFAKVEIVIHVAVEMIRPVVPRPGTDEYAA
jgi:hypothetical protein